MGVRDHVQSNLDNYVIEIGIERSCSKLGLRRGERGVAHDLPEEYESGFAD